jgi:hypothetical protein
MKIAKGPKVKAVSLNDRVALTIKERHRWKGVRIDFGTHTIDSVWLRSPRAAKEFLELQRARRGQRRRIGEDEEIEI